TVSTGGTITGTLTVSTNASGIASFTDLAISGVVGNYTLSFAATGLAGATSGTIALTAGTAAKLGVNRQPSGTAQSGVAIVVQPRIQIQDAAGNSVSQAGTTITASFASGSGTLTNATATTSPAGLATFAGLAITGTVGSYTLQYDAAGLTGVSSNAITLNPGPANHVTITVQPPPTASSGVALSTQPVVQLRDGAGNAVSQGGTSITASIASGTGGSLSNTVATTDAAGEATFSDLTLSGPAGNFTLRFGGTGLTAAVSNTVALGAGSGSLLFIQTQPSATAQNAVDFAQQPVIQLRDASNNPVNQPGVVVSASILSGGGTLNGTTTATTNASGVASFNDLAITGVVGSRTLIFSATGFVSATSSAINLTAGAATQLVLTTQPSSTVQSGVVFPTQPVVQLKDQSGNNVSQNNVSVDAAIATGGGTLDGTFPINTNASGQAAFTDLAITGTPGPHTLTFSSSGLSSVTSGSMSVTAGLANHLSITTQPAATAQNSIAFPQQPAIQLRDGANNPVSQASVPITATIASGGGTIGGTATVNTNASGLATFGNLEITGTIGNRTLQFTSGTLNSVASGTINIVAGAATSIDVGAGDGQSDDAGTPVAVPPRVIVADVSGNPVSGVNVTFAVASGGGSVVPTTAVATGVNGLAAATSWTLGNTPGTNTLTATSAGLSGSPVTFTATGLTGAPARFTITTQPSSTARNAIAFTQQPALQLRDAANNPVNQNGVQVTASIASGGGSLGGSTLTVNTDFNGVATFPDLDITGAVGNRTLSFTSSGLQGATSNTISLTAGDPVSIVVQTGDNQSATVDQQVTTPPTVLVRDVSNNPVDNVTVDFAVESGGGSVTAHNQKTDNSGLAAVGSWTLGTAAGTNTLSATSSGLTGSPVIFTATGTPDVADAGQSTANVPNGTILVQTVITIQARDQFGNALTSGGSDVEVTVTGANSASATVTDNGNGTYSASYLPVLPGDDTITITLDGGQISGSPFTSTVAP
ncbi:MAG TPA: invasin domain 3-containing protein, partial [Gemmatimonadales bacterium]|nr:invasin domain 3-containing protein [Gemmatimonadales bacterium]